MCAQKTKTCEERIVNFACELGQTRLQIKYRTNLVFEEGLQGVYWVLSEAFVCSGPGYVRSQFKWITGGVWVSENLFSLSEAENVFLEFSCQGFSWPCNTTPKGMAGLWWWRDEAENRLDCGTSVWLRWASYAAVVQLEVIEHRQRKPASRRKGWCGLRNQAGPVQEQL